MNENQLPKLLEETTLEDDTLLLASPSSKPPPAEQPVISHIVEFPREIHVNILTYLRAYDLASVHQTCHFFRNPALVHAIVIHAAEGVYPAELTRGFEQQPVMASPSLDSKPAADNNNNKKGKKKAPVKSAPASSSPAYYTFEHLRNMELLVVARVLARPEPAADDEHNLGYYVSKSWCKTALKWLEWQQERQQQFAAQQLAGNKKNKKLSKKQQRLRQRKYSDASPPWPNVNSDIVCCHQQLQRCSNRKSARARRKVLDKQAWKCIKKLYPESIPLEAKEGECLQCILEAETEKKTQQQREEQLKEERRAPLSQPVLRRFYTRTRGVPVHCLKEKTTEDTKLPAVVSPSDLKTPSKGCGCPLVPGVYYAVPRSWCHAWRKYMRTGEGGPLLAPDGSALLCDAHRLSLLPPHLESYLYGESPQLWVTKKQQLEEEQQQSLDESSPSLFASPVAARRSVVGLSPQSVLPLPAELGLSPAEVAQQQRAMMTLERQREQQLEREAAALQQLQDENGRRSSIGEQLDRENYCCVEILAHDELEALEKLWPRGSMFRLSFEVTAGGEVAFSTPPCRECDASGMAYFCKIPKNSKASLRATHQARVRIYKEHRSSSSGTNSSGNSKPGLQVEY